MKRAGAWQTHPERVLSGGFAVLIVLGTALLALPGASADGHGVGLGAALFTAASAVCVTGLSTIDPGSVLSLFGQLVLLVLIQLGGLGFMVFATLAMTAMGRRITLRGRLIIRESLSAATLSETVRLIRWYAWMTGVIELFGAALLAVRFVPRWGWLQGVYLSIWHAVSAFCNAGFDLFGSSMMMFSGDALVLLTIACLIILGGLGFSVMEELIHRRRLTLHAHLVLFSTVALLVGGSVLFFLLESSNPETLESMSMGEKALNAFFQSVTMRTAGFSSVPLRDMGSAAKWTSIALMLIGASPASTGGGVKTTTMCVIALIVLSVIRGDDDVNVLGRRLPTGLMRRALTILVLSLTVISLGAFVLMVTEDAPALDLLVEAVSAAATVGVSSVGTANLSPVGQAVLIPLMFFGRVGPLTLAVALTKRQRKKVNRMHYPEEDVIIG